MQIIFRKSVNTNAFGLRGYWVYNPHTCSMTSFAASADYAIGQRFNTMPFGELERDEGTMPKAWAKRLPPEAKLLAIPAEELHTYWVQVSEPTAQKVAAHLKCSLPAHGATVTSSYPHQWLAITHSLGGQWVIHSPEVGISDWPVAFGVEAV